MELERLFTTLVEAIRATDPTRLHHPHRLGDIQFEYVPYRRVRLALDLSCSEDHEMLLLRLCAGEGGYVTIGEAEAFEAFRREADGLNPDLGLLQLYRDVEVRLEDAAIQRALAGPAEATAAYRPPEDQADQRTAAEPAPEHNAGATVIPLNRDPDPANAELPAPPPIPEPTPLHVPNRDRAGAEPEARHPGFDLLPDTEAEEAPAPTGAPCAYCGGELPLHRQANFCPHCGQNLNAIRCAKCHGELEYGWRHCVTCGHPVPDD